MLTYPMYTLRRGVLKDIRRRSVVFQYMRTSELYENTCCRCMNLGNCMRQTFGEWNLDFVPVHDDSGRLVELVPIQGDSIRRYILFGVSFYSYTKLLFHTWHETITPPLLDKTLRGSEMRCQKGAFTHT